MIYNFETWSKIIFEYQNLNEFKEKFSFKDGLYHFENNPKEMDLLVKNNEHSDFILVFFNAAITNREKKVAPFFSGLKLSEELKLPLISFSDPTISLNKNIGLSWYAGSKDNLELQKNIAEILDYIKAKFNKKLILIGGSGGGFAALAIYQLMKEEAYVISINPQISISEYYKKHVRNYINIAFNKGFKVNSPNSEYKKFLDNKKILNDLSFLNKNKNICILQNKKDEHHVDNHLNRIIKNSDFKDVVPGSLYKINSSNSCILLGSWGDGHIPPESDFLKKVILCIQKDLNAYEIGKIYFEYMYDKICLNYYKKKNRINFKINNNLGESYYYLFILYENNNEVCRTNYLKGSNFYLEYLFSNEKRYKVRYFIKDSLNNRIGKTIVVN